MGLRSFVCRAAAAVPWALRACLAAVAFATAACSAADVQVSPVSLHFGSGEAAQALWITNAGQGPVQVQVRIQRWTQAAGADLLQPTRELVASPPAAAIAPGQRQLVRIVRPAPSPAQEERTYRVIVDELPVGAAPDAAEPEPSTRGLRLLLRYSLPVFVAPAGTPAMPPSPSDLSALTAHLERGPVPSLHIANRGTRRVRLSALAHEDRDGRRTPLVPGLVGYVLAGSAMAWELPRLRTLPAGTLKARFNDDVLEQALPLPPQDL